MNKLVVGLGNPGIKYRSTRHNIGQTLLDYLDFSGRLDWNTKFKGQYSAVSVNKDKVIFLKPETYMNLSGESVVLAANFFRVSIENILIIHDELDFPFGMLSFKKGGGLAGHNGLKSIAHSLGGQGFIRLRMGIGRPEKRYHNISSWVLSRFNDDEEKLLKYYLKNAADSVMLFIDEGFDKAALNYNKKVVV